ncbi:hypothetical protein [Candidatus Poriferisodalis sp.]|uniref:hypothetical protein n=1 Tax=Candidatus Poriferisodalis sp. TaxID=3101277 RepID=UPI003B0274FD
MKALVQKWEQIARPRPGPQDLHHTIAAQQAREIAEDLRAEQERIIAKLSVSSINSNTAYAAGYNAAMKDALDVFGEA